MSNVIHRTMSRNAGNLASLIVFFALVLASIFAVTGCALPASGGYDYDPAPDASVPADAGEVDAADADTPAETSDASTTDTEPEYQIGDPCWCCSWAPGSAYPNGDVYCAKGEVTILEGKMCLAFAGENAPAWAPTKVGCLLDNPWGQP